MKFDIQKREKIFQFHEASKPKYNNTTKQRGQRRNKNEIYFFLNDSLLRIRTRK